MLNNFISHQLFFLILINLCTPSSWANIIEVNPQKTIHLEYKTYSLDGAAQASILIEDPQQHQPVIIHLTLQPHSQINYVGQYTAPSDKRTTKQRIHFQRASKVELYSRRLDTETMQKVVLSDDNIDPVQIELEENLNLQRKTMFFSQLTNEQKIKNQKKSAELTQKGLERFHQKDFLNASLLLSEAFEAHPHNVLALYHFALSQYQLKNESRAFALLLLAENGAPSKAEYNYYLGLANLKVRNVNQGLDALEAAQDLDDPYYSASAAYLAALTHFQKDDFDAAQKNLKYILDKPNRSDLKTEASLLLEKIKLAQSQRNLSLQKFKYSLFAGYGYDSNVLNISTDNQQTNLAANRLLYGTNLNYTFIQNSTWDFGTNFSYSDMYSTDRSFKPDSTLQAADPQQISFSLPTHWTFASKSRGYIWGLTPSYQTLFMSLDGGRRRQILNSFILNTDLNFSVTTNWSSKYFAEYSQDHSLITPSSPEEDLSAVKMTLGTSQIYQANAQAKKTWTFDLNLVQNNAQGDNNDSQKIFAATDYSQPVGWSTIGHAKIDWAQAKYIHHTQDRHDTLANLTLSGDKDLSEKVSLNLSIILSSSQSNLSQYQYNKYSAQSTITYSGGF